MERYPVFMDQKINIIKMSILSKAIYSFNAISIKISLTFFIEIEQIFENLYEPQNIFKSQSNPGKKNKGGKITHPDFK